MLAQDQHVAGYALEAGKGLVIVVNKIDLVEPDQRRLLVRRRQLDDGAVLQPQIPTAVIHPHQRFEPVGETGPSEHMRDDRRGGHPLWKVPCLH